MQKNNNKNVSLLENNKKYRFLKIFKNDELSKASFQNYSLGPYRVSLMLNEKFHREFKYFLNKDPNLDIIHKKFFTISSKEYSEKFGTSLSVSRRVLNKSVDVLIDSNIELESSNSRTRIKINLCSYAKYVEYKGELIANFTSEILPFIAQNAKRYILYNLNDIVHFKSIYSVRLFELLRGFKYSWWMIKSIDDLRVVFNTGPRLQRYNIFKTNTLIRAVKEINKYHPNLELKFEEIYNGRKVESIKFLFIPAVKEIGKEIPNISEIVELQPIPNLKPLDKDKAREKLRLAAERKMKRLEQKAITLLKIPEVKPGELIQQEQIALNLLKEGARESLIVRATGVSKDRIMGLKKLMNEKCGKKFSKRPKPS